EARGNRRHTDSFIYSSVPTYANTRLHTNMTSASTQNAIGYRTSPLQERACRSGVSKGQFLSGAWIVLEGTLDLARLEEVLRALVNQHEILRTRLQHTSGLEVPVQVIASDTRPPIRTIRADAIAIGKLVDPQRY